MAWSYSRCSSCPHTHRQVFPDGELDAKVIIIGEGPGKHEDSIGVPFVGNPGQELDHTYLPLAGLDRSDVFVTNCVQCRCERNGADVRPGNDLVDSCAANHLIEEIQVVMPDIIILCGAVACSLIGKVDLELEHGRPRIVDGIAGVGWEGVVVPMYHPAYAMHDTRQMTVLLEDWEKFGMWRRGKWQPPKAKSQAVYKLMTSPRELRGALQTGGEWLAIDTESDEGKPYSIQFSTGAGHGGMILTERKYLVEEFALHLTWGWNGVVLHNATYDLDELDQLGIKVTNFRDTMQELYHLGNLPQALKSAVYRVFGYRMTSYADVVTPYSLSMLDVWLAEALDYVSTHMQKVEMKQLKTKLKEIRKPHEAEAVLRRVMQRLSSDYDPWLQPKLEKGKEKFRLLGREWLDEIEGAVGRMPRKSIVHAPIDQQVAYGCSDADWTGRLAKWLESERQRIVMNEWEVTA